MDKYESFKSKVYTLTGINLSLYKEKQMKRRITSLGNRNGYKDFDSYFESIKKDKKLFDEFINYLTINVSEFYRNPAQWNTLEKDLLPKLVKSNRKLNVWSSACSTGEEPYSLVMLLSKFYDIKDIKITATDIDLGAIQKAKMGVYSEKSLQNLPLDFKTKFFDKVGTSFKVKDIVKNCVDFKQMNLLEDKYPSGYNLILCRNVLIYFTEEAKDLIYKKFHDALTDDGILFVGSTEQIIMPERYNLKSSKMFFYEKTTHNS
ncbi:chemotaxis protein methyltransferase CheR [Gottschalkia acidurici 9a]|uniref:protein-glutamate O-methyltransferase n=1 Tax=Gottschalkia acidurici (strain ATCC 7906 / DSM 604 / BCRC 14475 / CIP 104303 / KCTC 5404 / NCIMB 10678 / 9a) TaxID=1128398 RepID=K0B083_GOTA9|nr:protein-glutamate O-methyltransferase CheR [Gottschalkia acidurici]AFS78447.1 chemotaxis protein methyltransferase CheR [Gottschalkia acidurici 9a]